MRRELWNADGIMSVLLGGEFQYRSMVGWLDWETPAGASMILFSRAVACGRRLS